MHKHAIRATNAPPISLAVSLLFQALRGFSAQQLDTVGSTAAIF